MANSMMQCPAASNAVFVSNKARVTEGCGFTWPSSSRSPDPVNGISRRNRARKRACDAYQYIADPEYQAVSRAKGGSLDQTLSRELRSLLRGTRVRARKGTKTSGRRRCVLSLDLEVRPEYQRLGTARKTA